MRRASRYLLVAAAGGALLAGCGTPAAPPTVTDTAGGPTATAGGPTSAPPTATPTPTPAVTTATLTAVEKLLYPAAGGDCLSGTPPSVLSCPLTQRLAAAISTELNNPNGMSDPLCGCQAFDSKQTQTYTVGTPAGGGTIHVTAFQTPTVAYVVINSGGQLLVDDVIYCGPPPKSIYGATAAAC